MIQKALSWCVGSSWGRRKYFRVFWILMRILMMVKPWCRRGLVCRGISCPYKLEILVLYFANLFLTLLQIGVCRPVSDEEILRFAKLFHDEHTLDHISRCDLQKFKLNLFLQFDMLSSLLLHDKHLQLPFVLFAGLSWRICASWWESHHLERMNICVLYFRNNWNRKSSLSYN